MGKSLLIEYKYIKKIPDNQTEIQAIQIVIDIAIIRCPPQNKLLRQR